MRGTYFRKVQCSICGDSFVGGFKKRYTDEEIETQEKEAKCGGYNRKTEKTACIKLSEERRG